MRVAAGEAVEHSDCEADQFSKKLKTKNYTDVLDEYAHTAEERYTNLDNMNKIVTRLMKKGMVS